MTGRSHTQVRRHKVHRSKSYKVTRDHARNTDVARLREIALAKTIMSHCAQDTDVTRLREIALAKTIMSHCSRDTNVTRLREIALARTMSHHARDTNVARLREILLTRTMSQDYRRNNKVSRIGEGLCSRHQCQKTQGDRTCESNVFIVIFIVVVVAIVGPCHGNNKAQTLPLQRVWAQGFARERFWAQKK